MIRSGTIILFALLPLLSFSQKKKRSDNHEVLFTVNGREVKTAEFEYLYTKNNRHQPEKSSRDKVQEYLDLFIKFKLKVEEARVRGIDTTLVFQKEYNTYKQELRKPHLPDENIIDSLVKSTYDRLLEEVRASHLLIRVGNDAPPADTLAAYEKIAGLMKRVKSGEDFTSLVDLYSEDESARSNHGDLGYRHRRTHCRLRLPGAGGR
jgi:peptidyl-prolyl cis-trans isomerase SurA